MKKIMTFLLVATALVACHENLEERAARDCAEETRRDCPRVMSPEMTMDSKETRTMRCYSTLSGMMDTIDQSMNERLRVQLLDALVKETGNKGYKDAGFNFQYTFLSKKETGKTLYDIKFTEKDYKKSGK